MPLLLKTGPPLASRPDLTLPIHDVKLSGDAHHKTGTHVWNVYANDGAKAAVIFFSRFAAVRCDPKKNMFAEKVRARNVISLFVWLNLAHPIPEPHGPLNVHLVVGFVLLGFPDVIFTLPFF